MWLRLLVMYYDFVCQIMGLCLRHNMGPVYIIYLLTKPTADEPPITGKDNTKIKNIHIYYIK